MWLYPGVNERKSGGNRRKNGNVEFYALEPPHLATIPVVAQGLDNQWVPRGLLRSMMKGKISYADAAKYLEGLVRTEYIRSLINGRQVVINRAFLYNNAVLFQDYQPGQPGREAFKELLNAGIIVPFLFNEKSPDESPVFGTQALPAWQQVCQEVRMSCLRFSWDDNDYNQRHAIEQLAGRFTDFAQTARGRNFERYVQDLGLDPSGEHELRKRLTTMARMSLEYVEQDKQVTRNDLYKTFVTRGENTAERLYDGTKPFAGEIKQLLDLAYNGFLADALDGYLLTPIDSPTRLILQEWQSLGRKVDHLDTNQLFSMLQESAFSLLQSGMYLKSMGLLRLQDVQEIRKMDEWRAYMESFEALLQEPILFAQLAEAVYTNYIKLAQRMTQLVEGRDPRRRTTSLRTPVAELITDVGGAVLSTKWTSEGVIHTFSGEQLPRVMPDGTAGFVSRMTIGDWGGASTQSDLFTSLDFMKGKMEDAKEEWKKLLDRLGKNLRHQEESTGVEKVDTSATFND